MCAVFDLLQFHKWLNIVTRNSKETRSHKDQHHNPPPDYPLLRMNHVSKLYMFSIYSFYPHHM